MHIQLPDPCLVVLIGASSSGKSSLARKFFKPTEILSSDGFRALISDDENNQEVTKEAFELLYQVASARLGLRKLVVVDATSVQLGARQGLLELARQNHLLSVAIVLDIPEKVCQERNLQRTDRALGSHVISHQVRELHRSCKDLRREGFRSVYWLDSVEAVERVQIGRARLWTDKSELQGPFDIIGDVHGCAEELDQLLGALGYDASRDFVHPEGRTAVFLGDLVDRGPSIVATVSRVWGMVERGYALCVPGNHEAKLLKWLQGKKVSDRHGFDKTIQEVEAQEAACPGYKMQLYGFLDGLVSHYLLDGGRLVVAHAGMSARLAGRSSPAVRDFALYGETTGETDQFGLPVRYNWARDYTGKALVVYGHTPVQEAEFVNQTICVDTGCVYGNKLTALRYPERTLVSVPAQKEYYPPEKPLTAPTQPPPTEPDFALNLALVRGRLNIPLQTGRTILIPEEQSAAALESLSRFGADPRLVLYLPPTMSPPATSTLPGYLEHPLEAFGYYKDAGISTVLCEEKHMGSRAVVLVGQSPDAIWQRFGVEAWGAALTRTGRPFFADSGLESEFLQRISQAAAPLFEALGTSWLLWDAEILPWSVKAGQLIRQQYAAVSATGTHGLGVLGELLKRGAARNLELGALSEKIEGQLERMGRYTASWRRYCWEVEGLAGVKIAPFHLLAAEKQSFVGRDHLWHLDQAGILGAGLGELFQPTRTFRVDLQEESQVSEGVAWWQDLTSAGGEGMVVKPLAFLPGGGVQPAIKVRGPEYLRIIYGPDYDTPASLEALRRRGLSAKRNLALREFALGVEALHRLAAGEPLGRVHPCVIGVLALESEPVDPRL